MNWTELQFDWKTNGALLMTHWAKLASRDLDQINGERSRLHTSLQRLYGLNEQEAEQAICAFEKDVRRPGAVK